MIFVTGCPRSGTSLTAKILQAHGCNLGEPNRINSLFENVGIRENVLKPLLTSLGADPLGQKALPALTSVQAPDGLRERVLKFMIGGDPRAYKDAKLTLVWPAFAEAFPEAKWVLVRRNKEKIIDSCMRTSFMRAHSEREGWSKWVDEHERRFETMQKDLELIEVWPDEVILEPEIFFKPVAKFCGLAFSLDATKGAIDRNLWHANSV